MKKSLGFAFIATVMLSTLVAKEKKQLPLELKQEVKQVIRLIDLTPEMTKELFAGLHADIAVECQEGVELPFQYRGNFGIFSIKYDPHLVVKAEKTCYLRCIKKRGYMSFDLKNWEKLKRFNGRLDGNIGMSRDKSHVLIETNTTTE